MPDLYPKFDMPDLVEAVEDTSIAYPKSWLFDFDTGDFVLDGAGNVVEADGLTTWAQWCVKAVLTQRLAFVVYNWDYGVDIENVMKQPTRAVTEAELEKEITEALMTDPRTAEVKNFTFEWSGDELTVSFIIVNAAGVPAEIRVGVGYREVMREFSISKVEQTISDWLRGELVNVEPTENGEFVIKSVAQPTFTRNSKAYKSDGSQVAANQPRFEQGQFGQAVLVEEGTTNLVSNPSFESGMWPELWNPKNGTAMLVTGWNGSGNATRITITKEDDMFGIVSARNMSLSEGVKYTISFRARAIRDNFPVSYMYLMSSSVGNSNLPTINIGTTWKRYTITYTIPAGKTASDYGLMIAIDSRLGDVYANDWIEVDDVQIEAKPYATSFIDGTRSPEILTIPTAGVLNPQEGTVECWVKVPIVTNWNNFFRMDGLSNGRFLLYFDSNGMARFDYGPDNTGLVTPAETVKANNWYYIALRWSATTGKQALFVNGVKYEQDLPNGVATSFPSTMSVVKFYSAYIDDLRISNRARTDAEILSAYQSNQPLPIDENTTYALRFDNNLKVGRGGYRRNKIYLQSLGICQGSHIEWSADMPANTTAKVYTSLDDVNFTEAVNGAAIEGLSEGTSLSDKALTIKQTMTTEDVSITPKFNRLQYSIDGKVYLRG